MSLAMKTAVPSGNCLHRERLAGTSSTTLSAGIAARTMSVRWCGSGLKTMRFFSPVRVMTPARRWLALAEDLLLIAGGLGDHLAVFFQFGFVPHHVAADGLVFGVGVLPVLEQAVIALEQVDPLVAAAGQALRDARQCFGGRQRFASAGAPGRGAGGGVVLVRPLVILIAGEGLDCHLGSPASRWRRRNRRTCADHCG